MDKNKSLQDIVLFGKIISIALLSGGYIAMGIYIGKQLTTRGYPSWTTLAGAITGTVVGVVHGAWAIKSIIRSREDKK